MNEFNPFLQIPLPPYRYLKQDKQSQSIPVLQLLTKVLKNIHPCTETSRSFPYIPASALTFLWKSPRILAFNTLHTLQYITFSTVLMHHFIFTDNSEKTCFPPEFEHSPFPKPSLSLHCMSNEHPLLLWIVSTPQARHPQVAEATIWLSTPLKSHCISW